jgi:hypothetical protein
LNVENYYNYGGAGLVNSSLAANMSSTSLDNFYKIKITEKSPNYCTHNKEKSDENLKGSTGEFQTQRDHVALHGLSAPSSEVHNKEGILFLLENDLYCLRLFLLILIFL